MNKKVVHYKGEPGIFGVGYCAYLLPVDHPNVGNKQIVKTSPVVAFDEKTGEIETKNTIYRRAQ